MATYAIDNSFFYTILTNLSIQTQNGPDILVHPSPYPSPSSPDTNPPATSPPPFLYDAPPSPALSCSSNISDEYVNFYETAQFITGLIVYPVMCIVGITGNVLALVVLGHRDMRTSTNVYLSSLAVSDTIKLLNDLQYFIIVAISQTNPDAATRAMSILYPVAHYVFNMSVCVTAWITVSVAVERFISVCYPSRAKELCTIVRARVVCTMVFVSMSILSVPTGLRYEMKTVYDVALNTTCVKIVPTSLGNNDAFMVPYSWIHNTLRGILPVFILVFLNVRIINELRKERVKGKKFTARNRITLMLIVIVIVFLVCITPDAIMGTFFGKGYVDEDYFFKGIREITDCLLAVNSALSFILYCSMSAAFRTTFVKILCPYYVKRAEKQAILLNRRTLNANTAAGGTCQNMADTKVTNHGAVTINGNDTHCGKQEVEEEFV